MLRNIGTNSLICDLFNWLPFVFFSTLLVLLIWKTSFKGCSMYCVQTLKSFWVTKQDYHKILVISPTGCKPTQLKPSLACILLKPHNYLLVTFLNFSHLLLLFRRTTITLWHLAFVWSDAANFHGFPCENCVLLVNVILKSVQLLENAINLYWSCIIWSSTKGKQIMWLTPMHVHFSFK